ncbi:leukotriene C4 synthase isoform X3 [Erinaceus europaeus]|uniref:Leukotriene C4 synthase isoform X3 n=1 Tax=Erinaceus europaeus TaxID=9365 RepID=A0ABM3XWW3_ERIEU|nr:leukotriene C4 synthase isoform X3 [Erinaceus europaeus]
MSGTQRKTVQWGVGSHMPTHSEVSLLLPPLTRTTSNWCGPKGEVAEGHTKLKWPVGVPSQVAPVARDPHQTLGTPPRGAGRAATGPALGRLGCKPGLISCQQCLAAAMKDEVALLATVTLLGVLLQAYFSLQVIWARRAFRVSPPLTTGPPEFERVYRAQCGGPVRSGLPLRAPPLLPGLRALRATQAGPVVRERACALAASGSGGARPVRPLPPGRAVRRAPWKAPDAAALDLRQDAVGRAEDEPGPPGGAGVGYRDD